MISILMTKAAVEGRIKYYNLTLKNNGFFYNSVTEDT